MRALAAVAMFVLPALGADCSLESLCEATGRAKAIFVGTLTGLRDDQATFSVEQNYKGRPPAWVRLRNDGTLRVGRQYLVFDGPCPRVRLLTMSGGELKFLGQLTTGKIQAGINGTVREEARKPLRGATVILSGSGRNLRTQTDEQGRYHFEGMPSGAYWVTAELPGYRMARGPNRMLRFEGCGNTADLQMSVDRRIEGVVVNRSGNRVAGARVEIIPVRKRPGLGWRRLPYAISEIDGSYVIEGIAPGRYFLGVNIARSPAKRHSFAPAYYPAGSRVSDASMIVVPGGSSVRRINVVSGERLEVTVIRGRVFRPDGSAVRGGYVTVTEPDLVRRVDTGPIRVDADGRFRVELCDGVRYGVHAADGPSRNAMFSDPVAFTAKAGEELRLVLTLTAPQFFERQKTRR